MIGGVFMSKFKYGWDEQKYERFLKEGRGKGEGKNYNPAYARLSIPCSRF